MTYALRHQDSIDKLVLITTSPSYGFYEAAKAEAEQEVLVVRGAGEQAQVVEEDHHETQAEQRWRILMDHLPETTVVMVEEKTGITVSAEWTKSDPLIQYLAQRSETGGVLSSVDLERVTTDLFGDHDGLELFSAGIDSCGCCGGAGGWGSNWSGTLGNGRACAPRAARAAHSRRRPGEARWRRCRTASAGARR